MPLYGPGTVEDGTTSVSTQLALMLSQLIDNLSQGEYTPADESVTTEKLAADVIAALAAKADDVDLAALEAALTAALAGKQDTIESGTYAEPTDSTAVGVQYVTKGVNASDLNDGLTPATAKATVAAAVAALPSNGGTIHLQASGALVEAAGITINVPVRIIGLGAGISNPWIPTTVQFPATSSGITLGPNAQRSKLEGFNLRSTASVLGAGDGLTIQANGVVLDTIQVQGFSRDGIVMDSTSGVNANTCRFNTVRTANNWRDGLRMDGPDCNGLSTNKFEAVLNKGWGINVLSASVYGANHMAPLFDANVLGAVSDLGRQNFYMTPDVEPIGNNVTLTGDGITWWNPGSVTPEVITSNGKQIIVYDKAFRGALRIDQLVPGAAGGVRYDFESGAFATGSWSLTNFTFGKRLVDVDAASGRFQWHIPQRFLKRSVRSITTLAAAATVNVDTSLSDHFVINLSATAVTTTNFTVTDANGAQTITLEYLQDATGGRTYVLPTNIVWAGGSEPSHSVGANARDVYLLRYSPTLTTWVEVSRSLGDPPIASAWGFPASIGLGAALTTQTIGSANDARYMRVRDGGVISSVRLHVIASSGNISVAAYRNSGSGLTSVPGTRLATSGAVACPAAAAAADIALGASVTVYPGDWLAISADNVTASFLGVNGNSGTTALVAGAAYTQAAAHPLPATPASLLAQTNRTIALVGVA